MVSLQLMARKTIQFENGQKYHICNRGVEKRDIFLDNKDYLRFYQSLLYFNSKEPAVNFAFARIQNHNPNDCLVDIEAYCLLPNHYHLIVSQKRDGGVSEFMKRIGGGYTGYFNDKNNRSGVLFQGRYRCVPIESDQQYQYVFSYVNENHLVHGLKQPNEILYTSSWHHAKKFKSRIICNNLTYHGYVKPDAVLLAKDINVRRKLFSKSNLEI